MLLDFGTLLNFTLFEVITCIILIRMFLKTLAVSSSVVGTLLFSQFNALAKEKGNKTHHPARIHPTK